MNFTIPINSENKDFIGEYLMSKIFDTKDGLKIKNDIPYTMEHRIAFHLTNHFCDTYSARTVINDIPIEVHWEISPETRSISFIFSEGYYTLTKTDNGPWFFIRKGCGG